MKVRCRLEPALRPSLTHPLRPQILPPRCGCTVCSRSSSSPHLDHSPSPASASAPVPSSKGTRHRNSLPAPAPVDLAPVASTSALPFSPATSVRLPNELIRRILTLARPPTTSAPPVWNAWTRIPLVHSRWQPVAREAIAEVVVIRSTRQLARLVDALRHAWLGGKVVEVVLDIKETRGGDGTSALVPDDDHDGPTAAVAGSDDAPPSSVVGPSSIARLLAELFKLCGATVSTLRWRGFGDPDVARLSPILLDHLGRLEVFEYSPCDSSHPPTIDNLLSARLASLKELLIRPSARAFAPLLYTPSAFLDTLMGLAQVLADLLSSDETSASAEATLKSVAQAADAGIHGLAGGLTTISLHSLLLTPLSLFGLVGPSFYTLRHLALSSVVVVGSPLTLVTTLVLVAATLESFEWSEAPIIGRADGLEPTLSDDQYWDILRRLKNVRPTSLPSFPRSRLDLADSRSRPPAQVRRLRLFGPQVFGSTPHKIGYALPPQLEHLTLGSCADEVDVAEVEWWLARVDELCAAKDPPRDEDEHEEVAVCEEEDRGSDEDVEEAAAGELSEEDSLPPVDELGEPDVKDDASTCSYDSSTSTGDAEGPTNASDGADLDSAAAAPLTRLTPASSPGSSPASTPSPAPSPALAPSPPSSPAQSPPSPDLAAASSPPASSPSPPKRPTRRSRRLSWAHPPLPPSGIPPQLSRLALCTAGSPLRTDPALVDRVDALVRDRGVAVEWYRLVVVVLETLELTRELRRDMSEVGEEWA